MATSAINIQKLPTQTPQSQEPTPDSPVARRDRNKAFLAQYGQKIIGGQRKIRENWSYKRRGIVAKVMKNKEFDKGNHFTGFWEDSGQAFDAFQEFANFTGASASKDDRSMAPHYDNYYTMLLDAKVAVLSSDIPKSRFMPANADVETDRQTAKAGSKVETIIERRNRIKVLVRQEVRELGTGGCYFKNTRYLVDAARTGTHKEATLRMTKTEVVPARYQCFECGLITPENVMATTKSLACPRCGSPMGQQNYLESHVDEVPIAEQKEDVANGMVMQDVWSALHVDSDPDVDDLINTRLLNLSVEVPVGWLRTTFAKDNPELWDKFQPGSGSGSSNELLEKQYRSRLTTPSTYSGWLGYSTPDKCTYSSVWIQPIAYAELDDSELSDQLEKLFPDGCVLYYQDDLPLYIRAAKLTDEWTHCATCKGYGLYPTPNMDGTVTLQERINDIAKIVHDWMNRMAAGILLALEKYIDTKALNGKEMLPGILNPVAMPKSAPPGSIQDMIYQVKTELSNQVMPYMESLKRTMQLIAHAPPQMFGGQGDPHIETKGGQEQQLSTAMNLLGMDWEMLRTEHSEASENAVKCAGKNMTEDWFDVVTDETKEFRNEFVHLDEMKGSVRAEPETDQGFPMTYAEIKDFFMKLLDSANQQLVDWLIQEPKNIDTMMRYIGVPGLVAPGGSMRDKALGIFGKIVAGKPVVIPDPQTGEPQVLPSIQPNKYLDDLGALQVMIPSWAQEHWSQLETNKNGVDNLVAFYRMCMQMEKDLNAEKQMGLPGMPPPGAQPQANSQPAMA